MTDAALLRAFVDTRSQPAFAELVDRHGGLVSAAARRLAGDEADDVAQAVFLLLAQRAAALHRHPNLAGWLYGTTRLCAANVRRARVRRAAHTAAAAEVAVRPATPADPALLAHLDDGLAALPDRYRDVLLLRYLEDLTVEQTAGRLGLTAAAVMKRSTRGLAKLRDFFDRRGMPIDPSAVAGFVAAQSVRLSDVRRVALAATATGTAPGPATALAGSVTRPRPVGAWAAGLGIAVAVAAVAWVAVGRGGDGQTATGSAPPHPAAAPPPAPAPVPVATNTAGTPRDAADGFLTALRTHDRDRVAGYLPPGEAATVRSGADRYIAALVGGTYARFPQRLQVQDSSVMSDRDGRLMSGTFQTLPPIDAESGHVLVQVESAEGHWRVTSARFTDADARFVGTPVTDPSKAAGGDRFDYGPAADRWATFWAAEGAFRLNTLAEADVPRLITNFDRIATAETAFFDALRGSTISLSDDDVRQSVAAVRRVQGAARQRGLAGVREAVAGFRSDLRLRAIGDRVVATGQAVIERADAQADTHHVGARAAAVEPDRLLWTADPADSVTIPGPLKFPEWLRATATFRRWQLQHDVRTFTTRDDAGNTYTVAVMGAVKGADGTTREAIAQIRQFRPDGTLAAITNWEPGGLLIGWTTLDATGGRKVWDVSSSGSGTRRDGSHGIRRVTHFRPDGREHEYHVGPGDVIDQESTSDAAGENVRYLPRYRGPAR